MLVSKSRPKALKNHTNKSLNAVIVGYVGVIIIIDEEEGQDDNKVKKDNKHDTKVRISFPRILFISPTGLVDPDIVNEEGSSQHKYFYSKPEQIAKSMKKVLDKYKEEQFDV